MSLETCLRGLLVRTWTLLHDESGQTLVEYALITVLISIVGVAVLGTIGHTTAGFLAPIENAF